MITITIAILPIDWRIEQLVINMRVIFKSLSQATQGMINHPTIQANDCESPQTKNRNDTSYQKL